MQTANSAALTPMPGATGFVHHVDEAPSYWLQGILWTMLADAQDTGGRWSMMEQLLPQGSGPPPHKHVWSDETFYILDGTITFLLEDELRIATKGAFVMIPRNTRHAFRVDSDTARFLNGYTPASWEAMIAEFGKRTQQLTLPPPGPVVAGGQMSEELLTRYGLVWLDEPDPLLPRAHGTEDGHH
jgi:quercetin dioxygenase-like cupin family protein